MNDEAAPDATSIPDQQALRLKAMDLLARREHAVAELQQKLQQKFKARGVSTESIQEVVKTLCDEGLVSDDRFTEAFVRYRANRGYGPIRIQAELRERGVAEEIQSAYLDFSDPLWTEQSAQVRRKRFGADVPGEYKEQARQLRFLQYRGFTVEQARQALNMD